MIMNEPKRFHIEPLSWLQRTLKVTLLRFYRTFFLRVYEKEKLAEFPFLSLKVLKVVTPPKTFKFFFSIIVGTVTHRPSLATMLPRQH